MLLPPRFKGENQGVYVQHVRSMQWLLEGSSDWSVDTADLDDKALEKKVIEADILVVHMLSHARAEGAIRVRRAAGRPSVFEISDNFLGLGAWLPPRHPLRSPLVRQRILYHAWLCDALQVYAAPLARLFARVNPTIAQFTPFVPLVGPAQRPSRSFVFGWAGTSSHAGDLEHVAPAIVEFCNRHEDAVFAYMGDQALLGRYFAKLPTAQVRARPFSPYEEFLDFVRQWNVGLAPLRADPFGNARTDTKFSTYAACGVAPLVEAHPVHASHRAHALLFNDPGDMLEKLESLYRDRGYADRVGRQAFEWAARERNLDLLREQRIGFYDRLLSGRGGASPDLSRQETPTDLAQAVEEAPLARLRRGHAGWKRRLDLFLAVLEQQPYDYVALRNVIDHREREGAETIELDQLYERLCLLAPEAVPPHRRPSELNEFLPS